MRQIRRLGETDIDPLNGVANFFDLGIIFALGFLLALLSYFGLPSLLQKKDVTVITNSGTNQLEIVRKKGIKIEKYRVSMKKIGGEGEKLGTAYKLKSGEVIYVPEDK